MFVFLWIKNCVPIGNRVEAGKYVFSCENRRLQLQLQSYRVTLFNELFSEESCSVIGLSEKMGFQL